MRSLAVLLTVLALGAAEAPPPEAPAPGDQATPAAAAEAPRADTAAADAATADPDDTGATPPPEPAGGEDLAEKQRTLRALGVGGGLEQVQRANDERNRQLQELAGED